MWGAIWWRCLESRVMGVMGISHSNSSREVVGKDVGGGPVDVGIELACVCTELEDASGLVLILVECVVQIGVRGGEGVCGIFFKGNPGGRGGLNSYLCVTSPGCVGIVLVECIPLSHILVGVVELLPV